MIPGLDVAGLLTSLGTAAITKAIDKISSSNDSGSSNIVVTSDNGNSNPLMRPINVTVNLNVYVDKELVKQMELLRKENVFIDDINRYKSVPKISSSAY